MDGMEKVLKWVDGAFIEDRLLAFKVLNILFGSC